MNQILRFTISTEQIEIVGKFPYGVQLSGCIPTPAVSGFYCFGGTGDFGNDGFIWKILPNNASILEPVLVGEFPFQDEEYYRRLVFDGKESAWIFPGYTGGKIVYFNSTSGEATLTEATLLENAYRATTSWVGTAAFIFGGRGEASSRDELDSIYTFTPFEDDTITELPFKLTKPLAYASSSAVDSIVYIIGGFTPTNDHRLTRFDTNTGLVEHFDVINLTNSSLRGPNTVYVPKNNRIYIIGGADDSAGESDRIKYVGLG